MMTNEDDLTKITPAHTEQMLDEYITRFVKDKVFHDDMSTQYKARDNSCYRMVLPLSLLQ
jgi:hypothetical protein